MTVAQAIQQAHFKHMDYCDLKGIEWMGLEQFVSIFLPSILSESGLESFGNNLFPIPMPILYANLNKKSIKEICLIAQQLGFLLEDMNVQMDYLSINRCTYKTKEYCYNFYLTITPGDDEVLRCLSFMPTNCIDNFIWDADKRGEEKVIATINFLKIFYDSNWIPVDRDNYNSFEEFVRSCSNFYAGLRLKSDIGKSEIHVRQNFISGELELEIKALK